MSNPREVAQQLAITARAKNVRFPKIWDESKVIQTCGATLMLHRDGGSFNTEAALAELIEKYGIEDTASKFKIESDTPSKNEKKKRKSESAAESKSTEDGEDNEEEVPSAKKVKKTEMVAEEKNRPAAEAIKEMADIYFKNKDMRKGGVFSKAAKAIRECEFAITDKKKAMELKGVGKGIAGYIEELLDTGVIEKLEELRAGVA